MASLRSQAKKSSSGGALRSKARTRKPSLKAHDPMDPTNPESQKPNMLELNVPSNTSPEFQPVPMPRHSYLRSFATIPALRKGAPQ